MEKCVDIAVPFDDVHNLEGIGLIPKEDHVAFESEAADIGPKFRPRSADGCGQRRKLATLLPQRADEALACNEASAFAGDKLQDVDQI